MLLGRRGRADFSLRLPAGTARNSNREGGADVSGEQGTMGALEKMCFDPAAYRPIAGFRGARVPRPAGVLLESLRSWQQRHGLPQTLAPSQEKARAILFRSVEGQTALPSLLRDPALWHAACRPHWRSSQSESGPESVVALKDRASGPSRITVAPEIV